MLRFFLKNISHSVSLLHKQELPIFHIQRYMLLSLHLRVGQLRHKIALSKIPGGDSKQIRIYKNIPWFLWDVAQWLDSPYEETIAKEIFYYLDTTPAPKFRECQCPLSLRSLWSCYMSLYSSYARSAMYNAKSGNQAGTVPGYGPKSLIPHILTISVLLCLCASLVETKLTAG